MNRSLWLGMALISCVGELPADDTLAAALTFHASFDASADADFAKGNPRIHTIDQFGGEQVIVGIGIDQVTVEPGKGRWGGALSFRDVSKQILMFLGEGNMPYDKQGFDATVSFWMSLTPHEDLKPGYVDPIQITDKKWNDASIFIDFTKDNPRELRLGCFSDYQHWNPQDTKWEEVAELDRPLVTVSQPPFSRDKWTHVAIVLEKMNATDAPSVARLYLNGRLQGQNLGPHQISWNPEQLRIMLGIQYIGRFDDLAIFNQAFTLEQLRTLMRLENGVKDLAADQQ